VPRRWRRGGPRPRTYRGGRVRGPGGRRGRGAPGRVRGARRLALRRAGGEGGAPGLRAGAEAGSSTTDRQTTDRADPPGRSVASSGAMRALPLLLLAAAAACASVPVPHLPSPRLVHGGPASTRPTRWQRPSTARASRRRSRSLAPRSCCARSRSPPGRTRSPPGPRCCWATPTLPGGTSRPPPPTSTPTPPRSSCPSWAPSRAPRATPPRASSTSCARATRSRTCGAEAAARLAAYHDRLARFGEVEARWRAWG
jgi:hypothetical protein